LLASAAVEEVLSGDLPPYGDGGRENFLDQIPDDVRREPLDILLDRERWMTIEDGIKSELSVRDQQIMALHYFEDLTLVEIGQRLGISESRVCQIKYDAIEKLHRKLVRQSGFVFLNWNPRAVMRMAILIFILVGLALIIAGC